MSITPQQLAAGLRAFANALDGGNTNEAPGALQGVGTYSPPPPVVQQPPPVQQQMAQPGPTVTAEQLMGLIQPHIGNEAIKAQLGQAMRNMGVDALPNAQPHQYGALFVAFQQVLAANGIGGAAPQPAPNASII